jgi:DNA-binding transcriptional ArsR family regulator
MIRKKIIFSEKQEHVMRFYVKPFDDKDKKILSVLRQKRFREIIYLVLSNQKAKIKFLMENLNLPRSTLSHYLKLLVEHEILEYEKIGYEKVYTIINEDRVVKILITYKSGLIDKLVDKTLNILLETRFHK